MPTITACTDCGEDTTGLDRCASCWVVVDPCSLEPRDLSRVYTPRERRIDHRLRRVLDEMHVREIRERTIAAARAS